MIRLNIVLIVILAFNTLFGCKETGKQKPNVILILTDDQGYGDLACHGNPWIKTPNMDKLHDESVRFTNFHVETTCAPTRSGLMTGKYCNKVGVWHTVNGREILYPEEKTLAESFKNVGYQTAIFGKWHLGDNYPYRPQDRGFDEVLVHGGGGIGQQPDYWENDYFDDTYIHNGVPEKYSGYCTEVWFREAIKFIRENKDNPFFCFLPTNAPHGPFHVAQKYIDMYKDNPEIPNPNFYGMITNLDENLGELRNELDKLGIANNTILVFMTDNGTSSGVKLGEGGKVIGGFNAGMRGKKGWTLEGGHRVPFFIHWPAGGLNGGKDISTLTSYIDFMPTIMDLCGISRSPESCDGESLKSLIDGSNEKWEDRVLFVDTQREENLIKWKSFVAMTNRWRLVGKDKLFDMNVDPGQNNNVIQEHPEVVEKLLAAYEKWWDYIYEGNKYSYIQAGSSFEKEVRLNSHDYHTEDGLPAFSQEWVRLAKGATGFWAVEFLHSGKYKIELTRWPKEANLKMCNSAPKGEEIPGGEAYSIGIALEITEATLKINGKEQSIAVSDADSSASFIVDVEKGKYQVEGILKDIHDKEYGAYYAYISYLEEK